MVRVGIIGCGSITKFRHAPEYSINKDSEIAGFFDPVNERAQEMANLYGGKIYETYESMLADRSIDAVSVCAANSFHAPITIEALKAGKHVLCEKPMATSVSDAIKMNEAAKQAGKYLMIGHSQRLVDAHVRAKKILDSGEMGRIISFKTSFSHRGPETWSADKSSKTWFFNKKDAILGAMGDLGIHKADLIRWLINDEIEEVMASVVTLDKKISNGDMIEVDDNAFCILKSRRGIVGMLTASWTNYGDEDNGTILYCTEGVMKICCNDDYQIEIVKKNKEKVYYKTGRIQTNSGEIDNSGIIDMFISSIVQKTPPEISGYEGLEALKIIFACMESCSTGSKIKIDH